MATALAASPIDLTELARARRTDAMPKHSLFGSTLEMHNKDEMDQIQKIDVSKSKEPRRKGRFQLPEELRSQMKEYKVVQATKGEIEKQKDELLKTKRAIENMEFGALNFDTDKLTRVPQRTGSGRTPLSMSDNAVKAAREMNYVGLNDRNSYNRDKYGHKAPMHQYSLCGDILRPGMETVRREKTEFPAYVGHSERHRKAPTGTPRHASAGSVAQPRSIVPLPPNIRHQFGSRMCDFLLSDEKKVEKTVNEQKLRKQRLLRPSKHLDIPDMDKELKPEYEMLGNAMRQNIFPGYTMNHKKSMTKLAYDDSVHLRRYPDPDQWRYQRDELSTWAEQNILYERMRKSFREFLSSMPKAERNWEKGAIPKPKPKSDQAPPKPKPKPKKPTTKSKPEEPAFEEVVFKTPPVTPPPPQPEKVTLAPKKEKDNEFWDFYDKK